MSVHLTSSTSSVATGTGFSNYSLPNSLPGPCQPIYSEITVSWAIKWSDTKFFEISVPILQSLYQNAGQINKLTRPLNSVLYLCRAIEISEDADNHFEGCSTLTTCRYLNALMLYNALQDLNVTDAKSLLKQFESKVPTWILWWDWMGYEMYIVPQALYEDPQTSAPFPSYSLEQIPVISGLCDYSRILFICSALSDIHYGRIDVPQEWIQQAYQNILVNVPLKTEQKGLRQLYSYLEKQMKALIG